jgi:hypothetical protein
MATFLGSYGNRSSLEYLVNESDRKKVARQLYQHAELIRGFNTHPAFLEHRLEVIESIAPVSEAAAGTGNSINARKATGRLVAYEVMNNAGQVDEAKTFDLALFWKDHVRYDELALWYDRFNPDGSLSCQLLVTVPEASESWSLSNPKRDLVTYYNGKINAKGELVEIVA